MSWFSAQSQPTKCYSRLHRPLHTRPSGSGSGLFCRHSRNQTEYPHPGVSVVGVPTKFSRVGVHRASGCMGEGVRDTALNSGRACSPIIPQPVLSSEGSSATAEAMRRRAHGKAAALQTLSCLSLTMIQAADTVIGRP